MIRRMWSSTKAASTVSRHWSRLSHRRSPTAPRWTPADSGTSRPNGVIKRSSSASAVVHHRSALSGSVASGSSEQHLGASVTFCSNAAVTTPLSTAVCTPSQISERPQKVNSSVSLKSPIYHPSLWVVFRHSLKCKYL